MSTSRFVVENNKPAEKNPLEFDKKSKSSYSYRGLVSDSYFVLGWN